MTKLLNKSHLMMNKNHYVDSMEDMENTNYYQQLGIK